VLNGLPRIIHLVLEPPWLIDVENLGLDLDAAVLDRRGEDVADVRRVLERNGIGSLNRASAGAMRSPPLSVVGVLAMPVMTRWSASMLLISKTEYARCNIRRLW
jgi:hypothetical protein